MITLRQKLIKMVSFLFSSDCPYEIHDEILEEINHAFMKFFSPQNQKDSFDKFWTHLNNVYHLPHGFKLYMLQALEIAGIDTDNTFVLNASCAPNDDICAICHENSENNWVIFVCGHKFHGQCGQIWLNCHSNCPMCRQEINQTSYEILESIN